MIYFSQGMECYQCNNYFAGLDEVLVHYPAIAVAVQYLGLPGKERHKRPFLGGVARASDTEDTFKLTMPLADPRLTFHADRRFEAEAVMKPGPAFDLGRFRRALHRVALSFTGLQEGADYVLAERFDRVRDYTRRPRRGEDGWPYVQIEPPTKEMPRIARASCYERGERHLVLLQFFQTFFVVDLLGRGDLEQLVEERGGTYVGAGALVPPIMVRFGGTPTTSDDTDSAP